MTALITAITVAAGFGLGAFALGMAGWLALERFVWRDQV